LFRFYTSRSAVETLHHSFYLDVEALHRRRRVVQGWGRVDDWVARCGQLTDYADQSRVTLDDKLTANLRNFCQKKFLRIENELSVLDWTNTINVSHIFTVKFIVKYFNRIIACAVFQVLFKHYYYLFDLIFSLCSPTLHKEWDILVLQNIFRICIQSFVHLILFQTLERFPQLYMFFQIHILNIYHFSSGIFCIVLGLLLFFTFFTKQNNI
jgi:hypothetical protein